MNDELKREIILDNYQNPFNKVETLEGDYDLITANITSCIDNFDIFLKIEDKILKEVYFKGEGCAISTASMSILLKSIINKEVNFIINFITNFQNMVNQLNYDEELLNEAIVFDNIYKQRSRIKCATLPYESLLNYLKERK